jgi:hypothetical protein
MSNDRDWRQIGGYRSPGPRIAQTTVRDEPMVALYAGSPGRRALGVTFSPGDSDADQVI